MLYVNPEIVIPYCDVRSCETASQTRCRAGLDFVRRELIGSLDRCRLLIAVIL